MGGIFSRAWYTGLAEPGKRTVKHNNKKRKTTVKERVLNQCHVMWSGHVRQLTRYSHLLTQKHRLVA